MTRLLMPHPDDARSLMQLRGALKDARLATGKTAFRLSLEVNRSSEFVTNLERGSSNTPFASSLQLWASGLGLRLEFGVENFWMFPHQDAEMLAWYALSRPWGADVYMRQWLVSALKVWRVQGGFELADVAGPLKTDAASVKRWEDDSQDPMMSRAMWQARATGTRVTWRLWSRDEWIFG